MTGFSDRKLILKIGDGASPEVFTAIAALRDVTITETAASVETTNKDSAGNRTLLNDKTLVSMSVSGTGVFTDAATLDSVRTAFRTGTLNNFEIDVVSTDATTAGETLNGAFQITQFEVAGANASEINYSITLESSGAVTSS